MNKAVQRHLREPLACEACPLRSTGLFASVDSAELAAIQELKAGEAELPPGLRVKQEGIADRDCYTLRSGWAFRFRTLASGARQILNFLLPGDFIGLPESMALSPQHGVEVLTPAVLCRFPAGRLAELYGRQPRLASHVTWHAARGEAMVAENLVSAGQRTAVQRVAMLLLDLYQRAVSAGMSNPQGAVEFPLTQRHMADALGMSLVHTHRVLRALGRSGLYRFTGTQLAVPEPEALRELADCQHLPAGERPLL